MTLGKANMSDWLKRVRESCSWIVAPCLNFFFSFWAKPDGARKHEKAIARKNEAFTGRKKIEFTTVLSKVEIILIDKQSFGTCIDHIGEL